MRALVLIATLALAATAASTAGASQIVDRNVSGLSLAVDRGGRALLTYRTESGALRHVLAWGAVDASPSAEGVPQVAFRTDYSGGWKSSRKLVWKTFRNACRRYDGPALVWAVSACRAPDGSYWAVQAWKRILPMRGFEPWAAAQNAVEYHLSHWTGALAELDASPNFTYGALWQGVFGRLLYRGAPVYGLNAKTARYAYIDTLDSVWGPGWKRAAAKALHLRNGAFCYSFVPDRPPPGYPDNEIRPPGNGKRHRVTVMGPGVTPDVQWEGDGLGAFDAVADARFNALFDSWVGPDDNVCKNER